MPGHQKIRAKVCLVGDSGVGKTSLVKRFTQDIFDQKYIPTPSTKVTTIEFKFPEADGENTILVMNIWDISGQMGFLKFLKADYFRKASLILAVCDVSRSETLHSLESWIAVAREVAGDIPLEIVGNKSDSLHNVIRYDPFTKKLCYDYGCNVHYVSASTGENVDDAFQEIASIALEHIRSDLNLKEGVLELEWEILATVVERGKLGATKEYFFQQSRGINFDTLKANIESLEDKGYLDVSWTGVTNFIARATEEGRRKAEQGPKKFDDEYLDMITA